MKNEIALLAEALEKDMALAVSPALSFDMMRSALTDHINHLINTDFEKLVFLLYRIDVDETKMRKLLEQRPGEDSAGLIADLIIERQLQKIRSRRSSQRDNNIDEDEKW